MQRITKKFLWAVGLVLACQQAVFGYALLGPVGNGGDSWQSQALGYNPINIPNPYGFLDENATGPKNIGEGYRRNVPVLYYTFDRNFVGYFGSHGTNAVMQAYQILNNLTNVSSYSDDLSEFPLQASGINYQAQALQIYDLKSTVLAEMMEQLGVADSVRYTWTLHSRWHVGNVPCPVGENYFVTERNYAIQPTPTDQIQYTPYVNGSLYTYRIQEFCDQGLQLPITALSVVTPVDPLSDNAPISSALGVDYLELGQYFTGLTRDDMASLRYLLRAGNANYETAAAGSQEFVINKTLYAPQAFPPVDYTFSSTNSNGFYYYSGNTNGGFGYGDLPPFLGFIQTNGPAALQAAYPGVAISSVSNSLVWASNAVYSSYFYIPVGSPYGTTPTFKAVTNYVGYWKTIYHYQFANVFTNHFYTNSVASWQKTTVSAPVGSPYGADLVTNITVKLTNQIGGDFFVLPLYATNVCPLDIIDASHFNVIATTNFYTSASTNFNTTTNTLSISNSLSLVTYLTNYSFSINPTSCELVDSPSAQFEGIENIKFVAVDQSQYDYILGQFYTPITNNYTMSEVIQTNGAVVIQNFSRVVTTPDFLFTAQDMTDSGGAQGFIRRTAPNFNEANVLPGLAGPGTIDSGTVTFTFNKSGPVYYNTAPSFLNGPNFGQGWYYGSFDGTTNTPIIYPNGTSISNLENQVFIQISPATVPSSAVGQTYSVTFTVTGGTAPYTWSLSSNSSPLPSGLTLSSGGVLSGTPQSNGVYAFTVQLSDAAAHTVQRTYTVTIN